MMSKKDYTEIALRIKGDLDSYDDELEISAREAVASLASDLADQFKAGNPRFRFDHFFAACGLTMYGELPDTAPLPDDRATARRR